MTLHEITTLKPKYKSRRRVGRGPGSGKGKTAGRGTKGQKARTGGNIPAYFEGGQRPLVQIIPKRKGFRHPNRPKVLIINVGDLARWVEGNQVNLQILRQRGLLNGFDTVKILGQGEVKTALTVVIPNVSQSAREKIEQAGGTVEIVK